MTKIEPEEIPIPEEFKNDAAPLLLYKMIKLQKMKDENNQKFQRFWEFVRTNYGSRSRLPQVLQDEINDLEQKFRVKSKFYDVCLEKAYDEAAEIFITSILNK